MDGNIQGELVGEQCYMKVFNLQICDLISELDSLLAPVLPLSIPSQQGYAKGKRKQWIHVLTKREDYPLEEGCSLVSVHTSTFHVSRI